MNMHYNRTLAAVQAEKLGYDAAAPRRAYEIGSGSYIFQLNRDCLWTTFSTPADAANYYYELY
jgi:hypothetical protein